MNATMAWPAIVEYVRQDPEARFPRLLALDMDGTLLDGAKRIPDSFWSLAQDLHRAGCQVVPSSGRQLATLSEMFASDETISDFVAENGAVVASQGQVIATQSWNKPTVMAALGAITAATTGLDRVGVVVCSAAEALIRQVDPSLFEAIQVYYRSLRYDDELVSAVGRAEFDVVKMAVYIPDADQYQRFLRSLEEHAANTEQLATVDIVRSGRQWVDIMDSRVSKATGLSALGKHHEVSLQDCMAVGDYLNDLQMLKGVGTSVVVANAHPEVFEVADFAIGANTDHGVIALMEALVEYAP
ncbi:HAD family hydrolase [Auritidibacter ignavus]|uniref:HAD family hydrolase n=1 Tax=Auritidibacter ignavus TaxID=678932 RepID=UPI0024495511|nr:HAD family hydrolase [Auritidibacter ignavus]WGH84275.1 HAD family hydrolase [Auritidibacter ignavus]WHS34942.1 HAD family hydrolase [Auritidibacter ignavus]